MAKGTIMGGAEKEDRWNKKSVLMIRLDRLKEGE